MDINEAKKILTDFEKLNRRRDQLVKIYNAQSTRKLTNSRANEWMLSTRCMKRKCC